MMFHIDDHPEWVTKFEVGLHNTPLEYCVVEDEELWGVLKEHDEVPHVANVWMYHLFGRIEDYIYDTYGGEAIEVKSEVNAMGSSLCVNGKNITTAKELLDILAGKNNGVVYSELYSYEPSTVVATIYPDGDNTEIYVIYNKDGTYSTQITKYNSVDEPSKTLDTTFKTRPSEDLLIYLDFSLEEEQYMAEHTEDIEAIVKVNDDKSIRYLMVGATVNNKFYGMVYDYTGGGEYSEFFFEGGQMIDGEEVNDDFFNGIYPLLWSKVTSLLEEQNITMDDIGNYIYIGEEDISGLKVIGDNIEPIEVGNTVFEES